MGKARILEAHGEGRYTIEIIEARERAEVAKQEAEARIQTLRANIAALEQRIASAQATVNQAAAEQDAAINHYQQEMAEQGQSSINLDAFSRDLLEAARQRDALQAEQRTHELRIAADEALVSRINALPPLRQMQAWCADYTEDLSGEVATAEVPGEIGSVIIKPGFEGNAWSAAEDGALQPTLASTPAATFYNLAMLPGWQKWRPTFRTATLTRLEGDTCSITLNATTSSQQGLGVNARASYSNVPILYMDCNGSAFEEGDQVLVAFAGNVEGPTVVGFEQEPGECCVCEPIVVQERELSGYWDRWSVLEEYGDNVFGRVCPNRSRWRIARIKSDSDQIVAEVLHGGEFATPEIEVSESSAGVMRELPAEIEVLYTIIETRTLYPGDTFRFDEYEDVSYAKYAGGQWLLKTTSPSTGNEFISTGKISESGYLVFNNDSIINPIDGEPRPLELMVTSDPTPRLSLQIGCADSKTGEVNWP